MKRRYITIIVALLCVLLVSCVPSKQDADYLKEIFIVDTGNEIPNQTNVISDELIVTVEANIQIPENVFICGIKYNLQYVDTLVYPLRGKQGKRVFRCSIVNNDETILLNEDGSIFAILSSELIEIDISESDSVDNIRLKTEEALQEIIPLSQYQEVLYDQSVNPYRFVYYNHINGYYTGYTTVCVSPTGSIGPIWIIDKGIDINDVYIDKQMEDKLITLKVKEMFNTSKTKYQDYSLELNSEIVWYRDELFVEYNVCVEYIDKSSNQLLSSNICKLLIPLKLLINNA